MPAYCVAITFYKLIKELLKKKGVSGGFTLDSNNVIFDLLSP